MERASRCLQDLESRIKRGRGLTCLQSHEREEKTDVMLHCVNQCLEPYRRVVLGALSQGCAAGIVTLLGGISEGEVRLGVFVGMSGGCRLRGS